MVVIEGCVVLDDTRLVFAVVTPPFPPLAQSFICILLVEYPRVYILLAGVDKLNPQVFASIHVNFQPQLPSKSFDFCYTSKSLTNTWRIVINSGSTLYSLLVSLAVRGTVLLQERLAVVS